MNTFITLTTYVCLRPGSPNVERHVTGSTMLYKPDRTRTAADSRQKHDCQQQDLHLNTFFKDFKLKELGFFLTDIYL